MDVGRGSLYREIENFRFLPYWGVYDSPLADYSQALLPDDSWISLWKWCADRFERADTRSLTVVDLLSGPWCLADIRDIVTNKARGQGDFRGVCVGIEPLPYRMLDLCEAHGITYVQGDIQADGTWRGIEAALGGRRADLVLERGIAGLNRIEFTTRRYVRWLSRIWDFTTEQGGLIALGLPHVAGPKKSVPGIVEALVREWVDADCRRYCDSPLALSLLLRKTAESPASIRPALVRAMGSERARAALEPR